LKGELAKLKEALQEALGPKTSLKDFEAMLDGSMRVAGDQKPSEMRMSGFANVIIHSKSFKVRGISTSRSRRRGLRNSLISSTLGGVLFT